MSEFIEQSMRTLKLGGMAREWRSVQYENTEQYVDLLRLELREREANRINRMVKTAGFRVMKTLDDFIWNNAIELPKGLTREYMEGLSFLPQRENLIFMGTVGTGKTHLATAIALDFPTLDYPLSDFPTSVYPVLDFPTLAAAAHRWYIR